MKVLFLAGANSIHTVRWVNGLAAKGVEVHLASLHHLGHSLDDRVRFYKLPFGPPLGYFASAFALRRLLQCVRPDVLNAHYATGYGTIARLACFSPTLLSVWGSDVYDFPEKSQLHRWILRGNLLAATAIASTSRSMAAKTRQTYDHPSVFITPFGIDQALFRLAPKPAGLQDVVVIGTVKSLEPQYGVDTLIRAYALARERLGLQLATKLEITGGGREASRLQALCSELDIEQHVTFFGAVPHDQVPNQLNRLDIYVGLSRKESFGVAFLEAGACGKPVIVSDADGPSEVVINGTTGFVVPIEDFRAAAEKMVALALDTLQRKKMGTAARLYVLDNYTWDRSLGSMMEAYEHAKAIGRSKSTDSKEVC